MNRLYRSENNRIIAGIAGGLAEYFDVDVALVRLLWVLSLFLGGGILLYLAAWIIIPAENNAGFTQNTNYNSTANERRRRNAGLVLIGLGIFFLIHELIPWQLFQHSWPLLLIVLGLFLLFQGRE